MKKEYIDLFELDFFKARFFEKLNNLYQWKSDDVTIPRNLETFLRLYGSIGYAPKLKKWVCGYVDMVKDDDNEPLNYYCWNLATNKRSYTLKVGEDVILCWNNSLHLSDLPIVNWYCDLMKECDISMKCQILNTRLIPVVAATNDNVKNQIEAAYKDILMGKPCVITTDLIQDLKTIEVTDNTALDKMQYLTSFYESLNKRLYGEFGIEVDSKDKRAQINNEELHGEKDLVTLNYLSYYMERLAFLEALEEIGVKVECIPNPIYATEPNDKEIEDPEAARELLNAQEKNAEPETQEEKKEGEDDVKEDNS